MSHSYKFAIAQIHANPGRDERLNLAIVVFDQQKLAVYRARNLDKIKAISAALDVSLVERTLENLVDLDARWGDEFRGSLADRMDVLTQMTPIRFSSVGEFFAADANSYEATIKNLLTGLVEPEPAPPRQSKKKVTRLLTSVKAAFRAEKILAQKGEGIDSHRVLAHQELAEGLTVDLMLKNGAMHVVQTVDASHTERARNAIQEIGMSALVFEQARMNFGSAAAVARLVYSANSQLERSIKPSLDAAEHQGAHLVNWESRDDRTRFIVEISDLAEPIEGKSRKSAHVHASTQHRFKLN